MRKKRDTATFLHSKLLIIFFFMLLPGCVEVKDQLIINRDGSGSVEITTISHVSPLSDIVAKLRASYPMPAAFHYPPLNVQNAQALFPVNIFKFQFLKGKAKQDDPDLHFKIEFQDINQLLASPYGKAHELQLKIKDNNLELKAFSGLHQLDSLEYWQNKGQPSSRFPFDLGPVKEQAAKLRADFSITMPGPVTAPNVITDTNTATWSLQGPVGGTDKPLQHGLSTIITAQCPADTLTFTPQGPVRVAFSSFDNLPEVTTDRTEQNPDKQQISDALQFIPVELMLSDSFDFTGQGAVEAGGKLRGAFSLPRSLAPAQWGEVHPLEIMDDLGNNLLLNKDNESVERLEIPSELIKRNEITKLNDYYFTSFGFRSPSHDARALASIKGSVDLHYLGTNSLIAIKNIITAENIMEEPEDIPSLLNADQKSIGTYTFPDNGATFIVHNCLKAEGMTLIIIEIKGKAEVLSSFLFDRNNRNWPGYFLNSPEGPNHFLFVIPGAPPPPLSFGVMVSKGPVITTEFSIQNIKLNHANPLKKDS